MTKKLEINFTKKPEMVFQFDQFLNVEQAVDKFLNKKENLERLIAPLIPTNLEETIQKLIPEVEDGKTPIKGIDYDDGKDGETPDEETLLELIKTQIPEPIPGNDGITPKKGVDYFTKKELEDIKKGLKEAIMSEMTNHVTKEEVNIRLEEIKKQVNSLPQSGGAQFLRQLMDVNVGVPTAQQYGLTYNPSRSEFSLTAITGGGGAVDSVNGQTGVVVLDAGDISGFATVATTGSYNDLSDKPTIPTGTIDGTLTTNELVYSVDSNTVGSLAVATYPSLPELAHVKGVTSAIQTQLNGKEPTKGTDDNYVTDAQLVVIGNTSGTNTGDNATNSQYSGLVSNATHSGDIVGATSTTAQPAMITGKPSATVAGGDLLLIADINDSNALKQVTAQSIADLGGASGASATGTGGLVRATSPTLVTPALGTPTALVLTNATGLPVAGGGTGLATTTAYGVIHGGTTSTGNFQNSGTPGASGTVYTSTGATSLPTWQTPAAAVSTKCLITSNFETAARFTTVQTGSGSSTTFNTTGASVTTSNAAASSNKLTWDVGGNGMLLFANSPKFTTVVQASNYSTTTTGSSYFGIGDVTVSNTAHTFTDRHIGFKVTNVAGVNKLFATQANGTTETASSALTTFTTSDYLELICLVNGSTSVDYYWRLNGGALSSVTTLTGNVPTGATGSNTFQWSTQNGADATRFGIVAVNFSYER